MTDIDREILEAVGDAARAVARALTEAPDAVGHAVTQSLHAFANAIDAEAEALRDEQLREHKVVGIEAESALLVARILSAALRRCA